MTIFVGFDAVQILSGVRATHDKVSIAARSVEELIEIWIVLMNVNDNKNCTSKSDSVTVIKCNEQ